MAISIENPRDIFELKGINSFFAPSLLRVTRNPEASDRRRLQVFRFHGSANGHLSPVDGSGGFGEPSWPEIPLPARAKNRAKGAVYGNRAADRSPGPPHRRALFCPHVGGPKRCCVRQWAAGWFDRAVR